MKANIGDIQIANEVRVANNFVSRLVGLMFGSKMSGFDALLLSPANSIHTCFMRYNIDVIFLNSENKIVKVIRSMRPWRFTWIYWRAKHVLELPGGILPESIKKGDQVCIN